MKIILHVNSTVYIVGASHSIFSPLRNQLYSRLCYTDSGNKLHMLDKTTPNEQLVNHSTNFSMAVKKIYLSSLRNQL